MVADDKQFRQQIRAIIEDVAMRHGLTVDDRVYTQAIRNRHKLAMLSFPQAVDWFEDLITKYKK